jgi:hypothetical protein
MIPQLLNTRSPSNIRLARARSSFEAKSAKIVEPLPVILTFPTPIRRNRAAIFLIWGYCLKTTVSKSFALNALAAIALRPSPSARTKAWKLLILLDDPVKVKLRSSAP